MVERADRSWFNLTRIARIAIFAALAFGVNAPFMAIPNIETFSLALFLSGLFLGIFEGGLVALIAGIIFIFFNPNGPQPVLAVGVVQVLGFILFGLMGAAVRGRILKNHDTGRAIIVLVPLGLVLTLWYDISTNLIYALVFGPFWAVMAGGLIFAIVHIMSNTIMFGLSGAIVYRVWRRVEYYLPPLAG